MKLAIGTAQFGMDYGIANQEGCVSENEVNAILTYARQNNILMLDTAIAYGDSESRLGEIGVSDWQIVTKIGLPVKSKKSVSTLVNEQVQASLLRLNVNNLYGLLLHNPECLLNNDGHAVYDALMQLKNNGSVHKIGISIYDTVELEQLCGRYEFDIVQAPLNVFDRRIVESHWDKKLQQQDIELHVRSVFLQGLLLMAAEKRPERFKQWTSLWSSWDDWTNANGLSFLEACLRYVFSIKTVDKVIIGIDSCEQLREIINAIDGELPVLPNELTCHDVKLLNPSFWGTL